MAVGDDFEQVVAAAAAGDAAAIERLYRDTVPIVRGYLGSRRAPDVDDLTSDVYVSMMTSLHRFSGDEDRFRTWLLTIAHRRLMDGFRRTSRRPEDPTELEGEGGVEIVDLTSLEAQALSRLRASEVLAVIDGLTDDQRSVLLLRTVSDLPIRDIAEVLGKPETAVKALLRRALAALQRHLDEDAGDEPGSAAG